MPVFNRMTWERIGRELKHRERRPAALPKAVCQRNELNAAASLRLHWPEYLMEAGELALYMLCVCAFATLLQHPASPVRHFVVSAIFRRALMGLAVGAIVIAILLTRRGAVRSHSARGLWQRDRVCWGAGDLVYFDDHYLGRIQSRNIGTIHAVFCRCSVRNIHNTRIASVWDEHESRTNIWFSSSRRLLAGALDLFHCADIGHAGRSGGFSASSRGRPSFLR